MAEKIWRGLKLSRWSNEFEGHAVHETLRQSTELLDVDVDDTDIGFEEERRRLKKVLAEIQEVLSGLDSEFYPIQLLDQVNQNLQHPHFLAQLQAYSQTPQLGNLQTANDHITQFAPQIYQMAAMARPRESRKVIRQAEDAFSSFAATMESAAEKAETRFNETEAAQADLLARAVDFEAQLETLDTSVGEKLAEWQADFTAHQTTRAEEHSSAQIERESRFEELLSDWKKRVETQTTNIEQTQNKKLIAFSDQFKKVGENFLEDMKQKHQAVLEIHKLVGRDSVAGGYQKNAGEERVAANLWRGISMASLIAAIFWLLWKYWLGFERTAEGELDWARIITASSLTAIFLVSAGYASRQSKMHRDSEKQLRSFALETKALDPFIASLDEADQKAIKAELVRRMFGRQNSQALDRATRIDESTVKTIAETIVEPLAKAFGKTIDKT